MDQELRFPNWNSPDFEGQARFAQLQFLHLAIRHNLGWDEIRSRGLLTERYVSAFNAFLQLTNLEWPPSVDHPTVGLFTLGMRYGD